MAAPEESNDEDKPDEPTGTGSAEWAVWIATGVLVAGAYARHGLLVLPPLSNLGTPRLLSSPPRTPLAPAASDINTLLALDRRALFARPVAALAAAPQPGGGRLRPLVRAAAPLPAREQPTAAHGGHPGRGAGSGVAARALRGGGQRRQRHATRRLRPDRPLRGARAAAGGDGRADRVRGLAAAERGAAAPHGARGTRGPIHRTKGGRLVGLRLHLRLPADNWFHVPGALQPARPPPPMLPCRSHAAPTPLPHRSHTAPTLLPRRPHAAPARAARAVRLAGRLLQPDAVPPSPLCRSIACMACTYAPRANARRRPSTGSAAAASRCTCTRRGTRTSGTWGPRRATTHPATSGWSSTPPPHAPRTSATARGSSTRYT